MDSARIYEDISRRTGGDIYIGVVGPVRTGKSTFIKRFMETLVLPGITNAYARERARDELPQSGSGRTIMTAEPKFVPEEAAEISVGGSVSMKVRLIDCVGYMVDGAMGQYEDSEPRMVNTPWFEQPITMGEAAEIGTRKVISEHSTLGIVVTTDGTITDIPRDAYLNAEKRVITELKELGKPFIVLVNTARPDSDYAQHVAESIRREYDVACIVADCLTIGEADVMRIIREVLMEFPVSELGIYMPPWVESLENSHPIKQELYSAFLKGGNSLLRIRGLEETLEAIRQSGHMSGLVMTKVDMGSGSVTALAELPRELFYRTLGEQSGFNVRDDGDLLELLVEMKRIRTEYDKFSAAIAEVKEHGYGIVMPSPDELKLEEPEIIREGGRYGVRLRASAPSVHMLRADITTEVNPIVGSEKQSEELVKYLLGEFEEDPAVIWNSNIFGKSLHDLVNEGLSTKLKHMPVDARDKLRETLQRIINEGSGGLICIIF